MSSGMEPTTDTTTAIAPPKHPGQCPPPLTPEEELRMQAIDAFADAHAMALTKKKRRTLLALTDGGFATYKLGVIVANCCKDMELHRAFDTYLQCKRDGVKPNAATFANLLSLTAGFGDQGMSLAPPRTVEPPQDMNAAMVIFEDMKAGGFAAQESVYTAMVRCCCTNQRATEGLNVYRDMQTLDLVPKLRTLRYAPAWSYCIRSHPGTPIFRIFSPNEPNIKGTDTRSASARRPQLSNRIYPPPPCSPLLPFLPSSPLPPHPVPPRNSPLLAAFSALGDGDVCFAVFDDLVHRYGLVSACGCVCVCSVVRVSVCVCGCGCV